MVQILPPFCTKKITAVFFVSVEGKEVTLGGFLEMLKERKREESLVM